MLQTLPQQRRLRDNPRIDKNTGASADGDDSEDELADLDFGEDDIPVTGFAVASYKRNADFHELFPAIPEGDYLIEGGCRFFLSSVH